MVGVWVELFKREPVVQAATVEPLRVGVITGRRAAALGDRQGEGALVQILLILMEPLVQVAAVVVDTVFRERLVAQVGEVA